MQQDLLTPPQVTERADRITYLGAIMGRMRLMVGRRYIGQLTISRIGAGLELSHLDLLTLVGRLRCTQEVTVGVIAEHMRLDHSRVSRIVAELVKRGVLRREASQQDARRTVVALTDDGLAWLDRMSEVKHELLSEMLSDWSSEELEAFTNLYDRFVQKFEQHAATS